MNQKCTQEPSHRSSTPRTLPPEHANNELNKRGCKRGCVEENATFKREGRDAPGQNCLYITSGMHNEEHYRLATFSKYPNDVLAKVADMAAAGFYYSGFKDRIKCFSCGISVENWMAGDDGICKKWHKSDCRLVTGADAYNKPLPTSNFRTLLREYEGLNNFTLTRNTNIAQKNHHVVIGSLSVCSANNALCAEEVTPMENVTSNMANFQLNEINYPPLQIANVTTPEHKSLLLGLSLQNEEDRRKSFAKWPSYPASNLPGELAQHGFFYLGDIYRTQCFSCSGVFRNWAAGYNVYEQHRTHLSECRIVKNLSSGNISMTDSQRRVADTLCSAETNGEPLYPSSEEQQQIAVKFPCSRPTNPHMESLVARIASFDSKWPGLVLASKEHFAKAGFYFVVPFEKVQNFKGKPWTEDTEQFLGQGNGGEDSETYYEPADQPNMAIPWPTVYDRSNSINTLTADTSQQLELPYINNVASSEHNLLLRRLNLQIVAERRRSFINWPSCLASHLPEQLSRNGFFYLGSSDRIECFSCRATLSSWPTDECEYGMHRLHLQECTFW